MTMLAPPSPESRVISWRINWQGRNYRWSDLTVQHLSILYGLTGSDDWSTLDPRGIDPNTGYMQAANLLATFLIVERCADLSSENDAAVVIATTLDELRQVKVSDLADAVHDV